MIIVNYTSGDRVATKIVEDGNRRHLTDEHGNWIHTIFTPSTRTRTFTDREQINERFDWLRDLMG